MTCRVVHVIFSDERVAGKGVEGDIMRRLYSLHSLDGSLICQFDIGADQDKPYSEQYVDMRALLTVLEQKP